MNYYKSIKDYDTRSFLKRLEYLKKYFPKPGTLLEIGSGFGTFLKVAKKLGWKPTGIEPNKASYNYFKKTLKDNITVYTGFFDEKFVKKHRKKYDLIYSGDVIEHVLDPVSFLKAAKSVVKNNGYIVTVTPDFDNVLTKLFQIKPTEHLIYLHKRNLKELFKKAGLKIIEVKNIHRYRSMEAMEYSTTFTDKNNRGGFMYLVRLINRLKLDYIVERFVDIFKEDLLIIAKTK
jgi:2-polyprenyl-3-methyl-5-hydroxy-6-metoxy-1,4-benzoquinol methylase